MNAQVTLYRGEPHGNAFDCKTGITTKNARKMVHPRQLRGDHRACGRDVGRRNCAGDLAVLIAEDASLYIRRLCYRLRLAGTT